ncbi:neuronal cell adhesion molecule a isoform X7 [Alosa sapidissima]|uniref:neuronal cell adhesion molecule a isoform X7 n=1 Tax=Alosa sapidissima TaxID=34773 RepID=UPI001C086AE1|nr:neuronal cell adhesion molecule a isoform X7 [Alosa sapidissima]
MDRKRKWSVGGGAVLWLLSAHVSVALEVPLDPKVLEGLPQPPTITYESPKNYIIDPRENININCEAKGQPHPSFSWTRNGTHFDVDKDPKVTMKPNSGSLVIDISNGEKVEAYEGIYQCTAHNDHGVAVSNNIVVRQSRSPLWSKERNEPRLVQRGDSLILHCRPPAGLPPPVIFWMDPFFQRLPQNSRVSQVLNGDLYFSNVLMEDARSDYICYARFPYTQTIQQKQPITVRVIDNAGAVGERKPTFMLPTGTSSTSMVLRGERLQLECIADGLPTPEISWSKDNGVLPEGRFSFQNFKKTLQITEVTETDAGNYRCTAKNSQGDAHHVITVEVKAAPYWTGAPRNLILAPKESGILTCLAGGNPKPKVAWSVNGMPIQNAPNDTSREVRGDTIFLSDVPTGSSAVYQCNASNEFGYLMANAFVNVLAEPPRVLTPPNNVYQVITNNLALLHCASFGSPIPTITWFKDGQTSILNGDPYVLHTNGTLEIHVAQPLHSGKYTCIATNYLGSKENHVYLEVKEPTRILKQPEYKVVQRDRKAVFECKVKHDPTLIPTMVWLKDGGDLPDDDSRFVIGADTLTISDVTEADEGTYTCIMNTTLDQDSASATLTVVEATPTPAIVYERPDPPTDLELTDQMERSVQLTWIPGDEHNSPIEKFLIQYEDSLHERGVWVNMTEVPGTKTTARLDLSPYVYYSFRVLALNDVGYSEPSVPSEQYRTSPAKPDDNPSDVEGFGTDPKNLVISWKPLTGLQSNGPYLQYVVSWRQKDLDQEWATVTVENVSQYVVPETPTFVPFEIKVQAINRYGSAPEPQVVEGYSGEDLPSAAPASVKVEAGNNTIAEVSWEPVPMATVHGKLQGYKVYYWREKSLLQEDSEPEEVQVMVFSGNKTEGKVPGLHPYSLYNIQIRVFNGKGEGPQSVTQTFETPEGVPGPPAFLHFTDLSLDSLTLVWGPPKQDNGRLTGFTLKYQPVNNTSELGPMEEMTLPANETKLTLSSLKQSTRYKFYISANTIKGAGPTITEEAVTIIDTAFLRPPTSGVGKGLTEPPHTTPPPSQTPPPLSPVYKARPTSRPFGRVNSSVEQNGAVISWEYSGPDNIYVEYNVENSKDAWTKEFVNGTQTYLIKGLKAGTSYRVRVVAKDHSDQTLHSTDELVITVPGAYRMPWERRMFDDEATGYGPIFEEEPQDLVYAEDNPDNRISMNCRVRANPPATIRWWLNNWEIKLLEQPDEHYSLVGGNLVITNPNKNKHAGKYACVANNLYGTIISKEATVKFGYLDNFPTEEREPVLVKEGQGVVLLCDPPNRDPYDVKFHWLFNDYPNFIEMDRRRFISQTTGNLYIAMVEASDVGNYSCFISSPKIGKSVFSKPIPLIPQPQENPATKYAADIKVKFPKTYALLAKNITLECFALGNPIPHIRWRKLDADLPPNYEVTMNGALLHLTNVQYEDEGSYECEALNVKGKDWHRQWVYVEGPPEWASHINNTEMDVGSKHTMRCAAMGKPWPWIRWLKDGYSYGKGELQFDSLTFTHSGMYQCVAENPWGTIYANAELRVTACAPTFEYNPVRKQLLGARDGRVVIECKPRAAPRPTFTWLKGKEKLGNSTRYSVWLDGSLEIFNATNEDEGVYTCFAENDRGKANSTGTLTITDATKIIVAPSDVDIMVGDSTVLPCTASFDPMLDLTFIWTVDSILIDFDLMKKHFELLLDRENSGDLLIKNALAKHSGRYSCTAQTVVDNVTVIADVVVQGLPGPPGGVMVMEVRDTAVKLIWTRGSEHGLPIKHHLIQTRDYYALDPDDWKDAKTSPVFLDRFATAAEVVDLYPYMQYEFRVIAVNEMGPGESSWPSKKITTWDAVPAAAPTDVGGFVGINGELTITWTPIQPQYYYGKKCGYVVAFKPHENYDWGWATVTDPETRRYVHRDLYITPGTEIQVKVKAYNTKGEGPYSLSSVVYAPEGVPTEQPLDVYARPVSATEALVWWLPVFLQPPLQWVDGYQVRYWRKYDDNEAAAQRILVGNGVNNTRLENMLPDSHYLIEVRAYNGIGLGPPSEHCEMFTRRPPPDRRLRLFKYVSWSGKWLYLSWDHIYSYWNESFIEGYKILYRKVGYRYGKLYTTGRHYIDFPYPETGDWVIEVRAHCEGGDGPVGRVSVQGELAGAILSTQSLSLGSLLLFVMGTMAINL